MRGDPADLEDRPTDNPGRHTFIWINAPHAIWGNLPLLASGGRMEVRIEANRRLGYVATCLLPGWIVVTRTRPSSIIGMDLTMTVRPQACRHGLEEERSPADRRRRLRVANSFCSHPPYATTTMSTGIPCPIRIVSGARLTPDPTRLDSRVITGFLCRVDTRLRCCSPSFDGLFRLW